MKTRIIASLLALLMAFGGCALTSCVSGGNSTDTTPSTTPSTDKADDTGASDTSKDTSDVTTDKPVDTSWADSVTDDVTTVAPDSGDTLPEDPSADQRAAAEWCDAAFAAAEQNRSLGADAKTEAIANSWSKVYSVVCANMDNAYAYFLSGGMSYAKFEKLMKSYAEIPTAEGLALGYIDSAELNRVDGDNIGNAEVSASKGRFKAAAMSVAKIAKDDTASLDRAKALVSAHLDSFKEGITEAITEYMVRYDIEEGKKFLSALLGYGVDAHLTDEYNRLEEYRKFQEEDLVSVNLRETLENIYTHCLIAFPEIAFASKSTYGNCGYDCLTPYEFNFLLESLYERGYIIIDANLVYNEEDDCPNYTIKLPEGKKPVIFTFDDVTYDSRKMDRGMVDKLIVDEDGYVCTYTKHDDGTEVVSYDNELFPVLDAFVREHPDFTFRGGRGTLFFTGFDGVCGYRTQSEPVDDAEARLNLDRQDEIAAAKVVIEALRAEGWTFGSHGYNHSNMPKISAATFRKEINMWREEVGAIVGDTGLFCWPYGAHTNGDVNLRKNAQHKYLFDSGFFFFFGCGSARYLANEPDGYGIFSDRKGVTGNVLAYIGAEYRNYLRDYPYLFDTEEIWDPLRRPYKEWHIAKYA